MKSYRVLIEYMGLTGSYSSEIVVKANSAASAEKKALKRAGNRDVLSVRVAPMPVLG